MKEGNNKSTQKLNLKSLLSPQKKITYKLIAESDVKKSKGIVDLKLIKADLQQLKDPPITPWERKICANRLPFSFYNVPCTILAKNILGKILVRKLDNGIILKGKIVETESYLGIADKASHTYQGKVTPRNIPMYMLPGTIYVYITYGMYHCFNISSQEKGSAVLIRSLEPLEGIAQMRENRNDKVHSKSPKKLLKELKIHDLCNGPSKMCISMQIEKKHSKYSMCDWNGLWIEDNVIQEEMKIVECPRIGIKSAGDEWAHKPLRYYVYGHKCVSKRDKIIEAALF
ncbi:PREDICTED: probable DNA-3-methyladenine glycosylase [Ceratosolen solmsi marchali]|uniref:DNA-3-methyladenine glycosylase n=1 Tax=Ceratosolen solmsi marchali TaxID=326594 RepID=A0AAJ6YHG5_9HYME|nr:PREDICTED: probable DNA-3-methyladenine glycosylase [Ceratosolen solmsi marchali]